MIVLDQLTHNIKLVLLLRYEKYDSGREDKNQLQGLSLNGCNTYLIFVIFFTRAKFLENKIYTEKTRKLRQNTQKIANCLRYYGKIHSILPIFCVKSVKIYTGQKNLHGYTRGIRDKLEVYSKP